MTATLFPLSDYLANPKLLKETSADAVFGGKADLGLSPKWRAYALSNGVHCGTRVDGNSGLVNFKNPNCNLRASTVHEYASLTQIKNVDCTFTSIGWIG